jgi:hypothetical protein
MAMREKRGPLPDPVLPAGRLGDLCVLAGQKELTFAPGQISSSFVRHLKRMSASFSVSVMIVQVSLLKLFGYLIDYSIHQTKPYTLVWQELEARKF